MVLLFDIMAVVTFLLYTVSIYVLLGLDGAIVLAIFYLVRGAGHFWALREFDIPCFRIRFLPFLGGYIQTLSPFQRRVEEGFSIAGASVWVLISSLLAFALYLLTGNFICLFFASVAFGINIFALLPIGTDLDGTVVIKSIAFSISRHLGLLYMFLNIFLLPAIIYCKFSEGTAMDILWLSPSVIAGVQRFTDEYHCTYGEMEPMDGTQVVKLLCLYVVLFLSFLFLPSILGISETLSGMQREVDLAVSLGIASLFIISILESNIIFFINLKRRIFRSI